ncbi:MAG TPA: hypothetical protein VN844_26185 [Pyrinomonadaceae bacterium]|nr:hypothetical protein [Pyrinomonadaceae bacterium]
MTILIPLIGYMILFNERVISYLELVKVIGGEQQGAIPARLLLLYFGLCSIALGTVIYGLACPAEVKRHSNAEDYVGDAEVNVPMYVRTGYERSLIGSKFKANLESLKRAKYIPEQYWKAFLHIYFLYLDEKHPTARAATQGAYVVGLVLIGIPSVEVFYKVVCFSIQLLHSQ